MEAVKQTISAVGESELSDPWAIRPPVAPGVAPHYEKAHTRHRQRGHLQDAQGVRWQRGDSVGLPGQVAKVSAQVLATTVADRQEERVGEGMSRLVTAESGHLNYRAGMAEASLWERCEENPPDASCEECLDYDWELMEASRYKAIWKCRRCENRITQEAE